MNVQAVHAVIHTPSAVQQIIADAVLIAAAYEEDGITREDVFVEACRLLGQRATTFLAPQQVPFDLSALKANGG